jgi:hypothetical protein
MIMGAFEDIKIGWAGREYIIPARKALGAIARIEEVVTFPELLRHAQAGQLPLATISRGYAAVLRYAGADLTEDDVYLGMFSEENAQQTAFIAMQGLMEMMIPPAVKRRFANESGRPSAVPLAKGEKEPEPGNSHASEKDASKRSSSSRSRKAGALPASFGS